MLILVGSAVIVFAAIRALINGPELEHLGVGIVVIGFASVANLAVSSWLFRQRARDVSRPRSRATPPTCGPTPTRRSACSSASRWSASPAPSGWTRSWR